MKKDILLEYADMQAEVTDLRNRIDRIKRDIEKLQPVSDSVTGTRQDGTIGSIVVTGYPEPEYYRKKKKLANYRRKLEEAEENLLEQMNAAEEYIAGIADSEMRSIFRMLYIDNLSYVQVALRMNYLKRKKKRAYTAEGIRKKVERFFTDKDEKN